MRSRPAVLGRCSSRPRSLYLWDLRRSGWANASTPPRRRPGRASWTAMLFGRRDAAQRHHRRQDARVAVGDGHLGPRCSGSTPGACWCRRRSRASPRSASALRRRAALVRRRSPACSPARSGADARRRADVPLQQPRRAAGAAARRGGLLRRSARREGQQPLVVDRWPARWSASASWPRCCRRSWCCRSSRSSTCVAAPTAAARAGSARCCIVGRGAGRLRPAGGSLSSSSWPGVAAAVHRWLAAQQHPRIGAWATTVSAG